MVLLLPPQCLEYFHAPLCSRIRAALYRWHKSLGSSFFFLLTAARQSPQQGCWGGAQLSCLISNWQRDQWWQHRENSGGLDQPQVACSLFYPHRAFQLLWERLALWVRNKTQFETNEHFETGKSHEAIFLFTTSCDPAFGTSVIQIAKPEVCTLACLCTQVCQKTCCLNVITLIVIVDNYSTCHLMTLLHLT